jgi:hypothetical protein
MPLGLAVIAKSLFPRFQESIGLSIFVWHQIALGVSGKEIHNRG